MNETKPLKDYKGVVYDMAYNTKEVAYNSVEEFINDISDSEMSIAMVDFPKSYKDDEIYKNYKKLKDSQRISQSELNKLLDYYTYDVIQ